MRRPQFSLKTILWLMLVAALVAHSASERKRHRQEVNQLYERVREWQIRWSMTDADLARATGRTPSACDRSASPWDDAERRPSHANRRNALRRASIREEFSALQAVRPVARKFRALFERVLALAV